MQWASCYSFWWDDFVDFANLMWGGPLLTFIINIGWDMHCTQCQIHRDVVEVLILLQNKGLSAQVLGFGVFQLKDAAVEILCKIHPTVFCN